MQNVSTEQVYTLLRQAGVQPGDGVLVHSALQFLGRPEDGLDTYLAALKQAVGIGEDAAQGTIAVPTFNFAFARGEDYNPQTTPAVNMGVFSEFFRQQPDVYRTTHPMQSFALMGKDAQRLAALDTPCAFDDGSAVDAMVQSSYKLVLLGADIQAASVVHYAEQRVGVPYRYWKDFSGRIWREGSWQQATYCMYVRDMDIDARLEIYQIDDGLNARKDLFSFPLNYGRISVCRLDDFVSVAMEMLRENPWCFVTNLPEDM